MVENDDSQVSKILDYIDNDLDDHPEHLIKPDPEMLAELDELVDGIEIDDLPEDILMAALKAAHAFIDVMLSFYGTNPEVASWHMNGDLQSWDSFFDNTMRGDELDLLNAAIKKAEGTELIAGRIEAVEYPREEKSIEGTIISRQWIDRMMDAKP